MRKWWPLVAVCTGAFMLLVDVTIVMVALPDIAGDLGTSFSALQWVMDVYALVLAALLLGAGSLADLTGRRRIYVAGLGLFALASLACGLAPNIGTLIAARGLQGLGAAAMFATTMALLNTTYRGRDRGVAFGVWGAVNGAAAAAGPIAGGLLTQHFGWRSIFLVNLPISAVAIVLTLAVFQESRNPRARGLDVPGMLTFTAAAAAITYALIRAGEDGWGSGSVLGLLAAGLVALALFVAVELRSKDPMLDLSLFRDRAFTGIMVGAALLTAAAFAGLAYVSLWLQTVLGLGAVQVGLVMLPMSVTAFIVASVAGRFLHDASPRLVVGVGLLIIGAGALAQAVLTAGSGWAALVPGLALVGLGVGVASPSLSAAAMASVPQERGGMAAGAVNTFRQLGFAFGVALLGGVFRTGVEGGLDGRVPDAGSAVDALTGGRAHVLTGQGHGQVVRESFAHGLNVTLVAAGVLGIVAGLIVLVLVRTAARDSAEPEGAAVSR
ncbi:MFS transporter [Streptosporangium sp. NPDC050855]|uniref:MFS transporter n=1 Tax=Streptosporangium sp. NPDC050855 TaxID=3366194 RepID=UPI0037A065D3